jgi:hypothetical protein
VQAFFYQCAAQDGSQFSEFLSLQAAEDKFGALHDWISSHLASLRQYRF